MYSVALYMYSTCSSEVIRMFQLYYGRGSFSAKCTQYTYTCTLVKLNSGYTKLYTVQLLI